MVDGTDPGSHQSSQSIGTG